jgi:hypothetical protein
VFTPTTPPLGLDDTASDESGKQTFDASPGTIAQQSEPANLSATLPEPKPDNFVVINHFMVWCLQILLSGNSHNPSATPISQCLKSLRIWVTTAVGT